MNQEVKYTDTPMDVEESLNRAIVVPNFELTQEQINMVASRRSKGTSTLPFKRGCMKDKMWMAHDFNAPLDV